MWLVTAAAQGMLLNAADFLYLLIAKDAKALLKCASGNKSFGLGLGT
jgi:hypothetical protein